MNFSKFIYIEEDHYFNGRAIVIFDCTQGFKLKKSMHAELMTYIMSTFMKALDKSKEVVQIEELGVIVNLKNFQTCKIGIKFIMQLVKLFKIVFADKLYKCIMKDPPIIFRSIFTIISPFIDRKTRRKISFIKNGKKIHEY